MTKPLSRRARTAAIDAANRVVLPFSIRHSHSSLPSVLAAFRVTDRNASSRSD